MRRYLIQSLIIVFCISFVHLFSVFPAASQEGGLTAGGFQWGGSVELGYRFTDIDGSKDRYKETVNLRDGLRLFDLSLWGKKIDENAKGMVDSLRFSVQNVGDPYTSAMLDLRKNKMYELKVNYKQYKYFSEREDNTFFTPNTNFNATMRRGSVVLSVFPKDDVKVNVGYTHVQRDGDAGVPRHTYFFPMDQELNEQYNEYFASVDFPIANWDLHVKQTVWDYSNRDRIHAPKFEDRDESVRTYVTSVKAHTQFSERLDFDTAYVYAHSDGDSKLTTLPITTVFPGSGKFDFNTHIFEAGLSFLIQKSLIFHADYRFHTQDQNGNADTDPFLNAPGRTSSEFDLMAHTGTFQLEYIPVDNLTLRGGYRVQYEHVYGDNYFDAGIGNGNGGKHPNSSTNWLNGWVASVDWKPVKVLSIFGEYSGANFSNPYTWISPENQNVARVKIKYNTPIKSLSLKGSFLWRNRVNPDQQYRSDVQDYTFTAIYALNSKVSFDGSYTFEKVRSNQDIFNPVPFAFERNVFDTDANIWTVGATFENIYQGFGGRINGSYARSLRENPQNYADGLVSFWYKNKWVTPIVTLERTYLTDNVNHRNGFNANLLTLSLRKEF